MAANCWAFMLGMLQVGAAGDDAGSLGFPVIDFHTHLKGGLTLEETQAHTRATGIEHGICVNGGVGFPITDDAGIEAFRQEMAGRARWIGLQAEGREWPTLFSRQAIAKFDYVFTDAEEVDIPDVQAFMERLVATIEGILDHEPVDIYANPTYLPKVIAADYDTLWTPERQQRVVDAAARNGVAIEINARLCVPHADFIRRAKAAGIKFTFGTNNGGRELGRLEYALQVARECGLSRADMWMPKPDGQKPCQVKR